MDINLLPCPFCGGTNIKYSLKTSGRFERVYHACYFCNSCHTYGPRVRSKKIKDNDYKGRDAIENDEGLKREAAVKWNIRGGKDEQID